MVKVFAFGTLKRGFPLHELGLRGASFLGRYQTCQRYPMVIAGPWYAPMMFDEPGIGSHLRGELFGVNEDGVVRLDELESVGKPGNLKLSIRVEPIDGGAAVEAIAYMKSRELADPVHSAFLAEYLDGQFIPPWSR